MYGQKVIPSGALLLYLGVLISSKFNLPRWNRTVNCNSMDLPSTVAREQISMYNTVSCAPKARYTDECGSSMRIIFLSVTIPTLCSVWAYFYFGHRACSQIWIVLPRLFKGMKISRRLFRIGAVVLAVWVNRSSRLSGRLAPIRAVVLAVRVNGSPRPFHIGTPWT